MTGYNRCGASAFFDGAKHGTQKTQEVAMLSILPEAVLDYLAAYQTGDTSNLHLCLAPNVLYLNVTDEGGMRTDGIDGVAEIQEEVLGNRG
jgi:hypothetical protein